MRSFSKNASLSPLVAERAYGDLSIQSEVRLILCQELSLAVSFQQGPWRANWRRERRSGRRSLFSSAVSSSFSLPLGDRQTDRHFRDSSAYCEVTKLVLGITSGPHLSLFPDCYRSLYQLRLDVFWKRFVLLNFS